MEMDDIGVRVKELREYLGMTLEEFADKAQVLPERIAAIEAGRLFPRERLVIWICKTFGVSNDWLRFGDGTMYDTSESRSLIVAERMRRLRTRMGLVQSEFAQKIGSSKLMISNYERGISKPDDDVVDRICTIFHVSREWMYGEDTEWSGVRKGSTFEGRIVELRDKLGLDQEQFGKKLGYSANAINRIETGESIGGILFREGIYSEFGVRPEWLEKGEGEMFKS